MLAPALSLGIADPPHPKKCRPPRKQLKQRLVPMVPLENTEYGLSCALRFDPRAHSQKPTVLGSGFRVFGPGFRVVVSEPIVGF